MSTAPNIIVCLVDQLRAFEVGCYGNPVIHTPNVDRLAAEGLRFDTAVTNFPVCMAARSVFLSGQYNRSCTGGVANFGYPSRPGDFNMPEYPFPGRPHLKDPTLAEILRARGYHTQVIGKWHIHSWPHDLGFQDYLIPRVHHCHSGQSFSHNGGPEFVPPGYSVDFEAEQVDIYLSDRRRQGRPFFLYYNISVPHCPVADAPKRIQSLYLPEQVPLRPNVDPDVPLLNQDYWFKVYRWDFRFYNLGLPYTLELPEGYSLRHLVAEYYGVTTWMDETVGRMLDSLDYNGLAENTIVVFTSDHGDNLGSHGLVQKGGPTAESVRIPLVVRWPAKLPAGCVVEDQIASLVDLAPTIISLAGGEHQDHMQGRDLSGLLLNFEADNVEDVAFIETSTGVGIHTPRYLYFLPYRSESHELEMAAQYFFDGMNDPFQLVNLAGTDQQANVSKTLDLLLRQWHAGVPFRQLSHR